MRIKEIQVRSGSHDVLGYEIVKPSLTHTESIRWWPSDMGEWSWEYKHNEKPAIRGVWEHIDAKDALVKAATYLAETDSPW